MAPRGPKKPPRGPQAARGSQETPKRPPRGTQDAPGDLGGTATIIGCTEVLVTFGRPGGGTASDDSKSAWESPR
eukprot:3092629-Pyramimonas_sp.AAC.1